MQRLFQTILRMDRDVEGETRKYRKTTSPPASLGQHSVFFPLRIGVDLTALTPRVRSKSEPTSFPSVDRFTGNSVVGMQQQHRAPLSADE
jgi:hypothetical protein